jgi:uncharacterized protein YjiS (DUF1127 family)
MNAAMQQMHCGHAKPCVQKRIARHYLSGIETMEDDMNPIRTFRNWRRYNETVRELNRLNARELNDLGINRGDIDKIARGAL